MNVANDELFALRTSLETTIQERNSLQDSIKKLQNEYDNCNEVEAKAKLRGMIDHMIINCDIACKKVDAYLEEIEKRTYEPRYSL